MINASETMSTIHSVHICAFVFCRSGKFIISVSMYTVYDANDEGLAERQKRNRKFRTCVIIRCEHREKFKPSPLKMGNFICLCQRNKWKDFESRGDEWILITEFYFISFMIMMMMIVMLEHTAQMDNCVICIWTMMPYCHMLRNKFMNNANVIDLSSDFYVISGYSFWFDCKY